MPQYVVGPNGTFAQNGRTTLVNPRVAIVPNPADRLYQTQTAEAIAEAAVRAGQAVERIGGTPALKRFPGEGSVPPAGTGPLYDLTNFFRTRSGRDPLPLPGRLTPEQERPGGASPAPEEPQMLPMWAADP